MEKEVGVLATDHDQMENLCSLLSDQQYKVASLSSLADMDSYLERHECRVVILDLDTIAVDNRILRDLKR